MSKEQPVNRLIADDEDEAPETIATSPALPKDRPSATRTPKVNLGRGPYPGRRQITAHVDQKLFRWLKTISAATETPMVALMEQALTAFVEKYAAQKSFGRN